MNSKGDLLSICTNERKVVRAFPPWFEVSGKYTFILPWENFNVEVLNGFPYKGDSGLRIVASFLLDGAVLMLSIHPKGQIYFN